MVESAEHHRLVRRSDLVLGREIGCGSARPKAHRQADMGEFVAHRGIALGSAIVAAHPPTPSPRLWPSRHRRSTARATHDRRSMTPDRRSEEHTSELQSLMRIPYAVF